jgi:hypothetical protein
VKRGPGGEPPAPGPPPPTLPDSSALVAARLLGNLAGWGFGAPATLGALKANARLAIVVTTKSQVVLEGKQEEERGK